MLTGCGILDGIAIACGLKKTAYKKEIIIFRNDGLERPVALKVNLDLVLNQGMTYADLRLRPADIVFVLKGKIDKFDDFAEKLFAKGIYAVLPFSTSFGATYWINPTPTVIPSKP